MKPEFKYGLASGIGVCLWITAEYLLGFHTTHLAIGEYSGYFSSLVPLFALWLLLRGKYAELGPFFNLRQGLWSGLTAAFVSALIVYVYLVIYNLFINPGWLDYALKWKVDQLRAAHVPETEIREQIIFYRNANSPLGLVVSTVLGSTLLGGLMSLFITFWLTWRARRAN
jgi:hypothetical protein